MSKEMLVLLLFERKKRRLLEGMLQVRMTEVLAEFLFSYDGIYLLNKQAVPLYYRCYCSFIWESMRSLSSVFAFLQIKDDELLRRSFAASEQQEHQGGQAQGRVVRQDGTLSLSLEHLDLPAETRSLLQEGMALTGAADLLSYSIWRMRYLCGIIGMSYSHFVEILLCLFTFISKGGHY